MLREEVVLKLSLTLTLKQCEIRHIESYTHTKNVN